jgi:hypothetical protein
MMGLQPAGTPVATQVHGLDNMLLWITGVIVLFVVALLADVLLHVFVPGFWPAL